MRLVLTIRTDSKNWRWLPNIFDQHDEVKALRENFLAACRYASVPTRRLDLVNKSEIRAFWNWFERHAAKGQIDVAAITKRVHRLCDRLGVEVSDPNHSNSLEVIITANYAYDAFLSWRI